MAALQDERWLTGQVLVVLRLVLVQVLGELLLLMVVVVLLLRMEGSVDVHAVLRLSRHQARTAIGTERDIFLLLYDGGSAVTLALV